MWNSGTGYHARRSPSKISYHRHHHGASSHPRTTTTMNALIGALFPTRPACCCSLSRCALASSANPFTRPIPVSGPRIIYRKLNSNYSIKIRIYLEHYKIINHKLFSLIFHSTFHSQSGTAVTTRPRTPFNYDDEDDDAVLSLGPVPPAPPPPPPSELPSGLLRPIMSVLFKSLRGAA